MRVFYFEVGTLSPVYNMTICKTKITMSICAESSSDAVAKLRAEGMGFNAACKLVVNQYNKSHKNEDNFKAVKWQTLKKRCQREEEAANETGDSVPTSKKLEFIDIRYQTDDDKEIIKLNSMVSAMIEADKANQRQQSDFNNLMKDFEKAYNMLSPIQKQQFEDKS